MCKKVYTVNAGPVSAALKDILYGSSKKSSLINGRAIKAFTPPRELNGHWKKELKKSYFFLNGRPFTPPPFFSGFPYDFTRQFWIREEAWKRLLAQIIVCGRFMETLNP